MSILREFGSENELELKENLKYNSKESENLASIIDYMGKVRNSEKIMLKSFNDVANICEYFRDPDINIKYGRYRDLFRWKETVKMNMKRIFQKIIVVISTTLLPIIPQLFFEIFFVPDIR